MTTEEARDYAHALNLKIARELIDITWRDAEGCAAPEADLRGIVNSLHFHEKKLRDRIKVRAMRKDGDA